MKEFLKQASDAYYRGEPIMSDASFDILASHFDYKSVGHTVTNGIPHFHRMYSLKNCFDITNPPISISNCIITPKLDGAAISILFLDGNLALSLTRGDGKIGQEITEKVATLIPNTIPVPGIVQVNGEILAPSNIPNSRNYAAGALNLKSLDEFKTRELVFVAYDMIENSYEYWEDAMKALHEYKFNVVTMFDTTNYPTDGLVFRVNNNNEFKSMGYTSTHPRGAFALKEKKEGVITTLLDVVWQVGKSGVVSPVAILEPVKIGDATVSKATLHNIEYINNLNLEIGCKVEVIRSGEIIPRIVRRV